MWYSLPLLSIILTFLYSQSYLLPFQSIRFLPERYVNFSEQSAVTIFQNMLWYSCELLRSVKKSKLENLYATARQTIYETIRYETRRYMVRREAKDIERITITIRHEQLKLMLNPMYQQLIDLIGFVKGTFSVMMGTCFRSIYSQFFSGMMSSASKIKDSSFFIFIATLLQLTSLILNYNKIISMPRTIITSQQMQIC